MLQNAFNHGWEILRRTSGYAMPRLGPPLNCLYRWTRPRTLVKTELLPGVVAELDLADDTANNIYYLGTRYEYPTLPVLRNWASRDGVTHFFDIGANFGYFSLAVALTAPRLQVAAFEPNPPTFRRLEGFALAPGGSRVRCVQSALSDASGTLFFRGDTQNSGASHIVDGTQKEGDDIEVTATRFDDWAAGNLPADWRGFAKIDAEGHEERVLAGMRSSLERGRIFALCVEHNDQVLSRQGRMDTDIPRLLADLGFREVPPTEIRRQHGRRCTENRFFERVA